MGNLFLLSCAVLAVAAGVPFGAAAQPFSVPRGPACVAPPRASQADSRLADKIAAADRSIEAGKPGTWTALADLAQYACSIAGDRLPVDAAFRRCFRECADEREIYFAHWMYAQTLERFGDLLGAENQYLAALQSRDDPENAYTAYMSYASMLQRQGRTRDALDVLNRFAGDWSYRSPTMQLKLSLMRELGMDTFAEEEAAKRRPDTDLARTRNDMPPMSAIPVERNPLAQAPFGRTIEVAGNAWIEPAQGAGAGTPGPGHLLYHRASMPDPKTFARSVALAPGQRFVVVVDLGDVWLPRRGRRCALRPRGVPVAQRPRGRGPVSSRGGEDAGAARVRRAADAAAARRPDAAVRAGAALVRMADDLSELRGIRTPRGEGPLRIRARAGLASRRRKRRRSGRPERNTCGSSSASRRMRAARSASGSGRRGPTAARSPRAAIRRRRS